MAADDSKREDVVEARRRFQEERAGRPCTSSSLFKASSLRASLHTPPMFSPSNRRWRGRRDLPCLWPAARTHPFIRADVFALAHLAAGFDHYSIDADVTRWLAGTRAEVRKQIGPATGRRWLVRTWRVRRATRDALARRGIRIQWWEHPPLSGFRQSRHPWSGRCSFWRQSDSGSSISVTATHRPRSPGSDSPLAAGEPPVSEFRFVSSLGVSSHGGTKVDATLPAACHRARARITEHGTRLIEVTIDSESCGSHDQHKGA